ncbi:MAG TPA: hypothetical protein VF170_05010, partial [Planctomycetaceae bacterium]
MNRRTLFRVLLVPLALVPSAGSPAGGDGAGRAALDPRGRPDERLIDQPRRYYVWNDAEGWHLRTAAKGNVKFEGTVRVTGGKFRKFRPVGLEAKGKLADRWTLDRNREELRFLIYTSTSFDGFDFDVDGGATEVRFDLSLAGAKDPKRIFVGKKAAHPADAAFGLPADPGKTLGKPAAA